MHNGAKYTKDALERVIAGLQDKGYEIVPISQLIYSEKYHMDNTGRQFKDEYTVFLPHNGLYYLLNISCICKIFRKIIKKIFCNDE